MGTENSAVKFEGGEKFRVCVHRNSLSV